jgi:hypothetical protein
MEEASLPLSGFAGHGSTWAGEEQGRPLYLQFFLPTVTASVK